MFGYNFIWSSQNLYKPKPNVHLNGAPPLLPMQLCVIFSQPMHYNILYHKFLFPRLYVVHEAGVYMTYTMTVFSTCNTLLDTLLDHYTLFSLHFRIVSHTHKEISCVVAMWVFFYTWVLYVATPGKTYQTVGVLTPFAAI